MSVGLVEFFGDGTDATRTDTPPVDATDRSAADGSVGGPVRTGLVGTVRRVRVLEAVVVRRTVVEQLGGFRTDLGPSTDLEWIARLADADVVTAEVPHVVVRKRLHPESVTYRRPETRSEVVGALRATILRRRSQT
jgi:hypothetical protein